MATVIAICLSPAIITSLLVPTVLVKRQAQSNNWLLTIRICRIWYL